MGNAEYMGTFIRMWLQSQMVGVLLIFLLPAVFGQNDEKALANTSPKKDPRLFYVYTLKTSSMLLTASTCFVTGGTLSACTRRKRRHILQDDVVMNSEIQPTMIHEDDEMEIKDIDLQGSSDDFEDRDGKLLLYWLTTTSYFSTTSYTDTVTIASVTCTPSGATWSVQIKIRFGFHYFISKKKKEKKK